MTSLKLTKTLDFVIGFAIIETEFPRIKSHASSMSNHAALRYLQFFSKHLIKVNDKNELAVFKNDNLEITKYQKQVEFYEKQMKSLHTYYQEY